MKRKSLSIKELFDLSSKTALVTGGASGIGYGIAKRLAEAGAAVVIADLNSNKGQEAASSLNCAGYNVAFVECDVTKQTNIISMIKFAVSNFGSLDILVNNVGGYPFKPFLEVDTLYWDKVMNVNLKSAFFSCLEASRQMIKQKRGGVIINMSSQCAFHPDKDVLAVYNIAKAGTIMLTKNLALELAQYDIRVNAICPGATITPGTAKFLEWFKKDFLPRIPLRRFAEPEDIADIALFLASPGSEYITGTHILSDGGWALS